MKKTIKHIIKISLLALSLVVTVNVSAEDLYTIYDLEGTWKFTIGDNPAWANANFDDSNWEKIDVPGTWEGQGFNHYNGYAWYRKSFKLRYAIDKEWVYLSLGCIDDADEVYLNGQFVGGMGGMQENPSTAYNIERNYPIPVAMLNMDGKNTIAVRVYDFHSAGGFTHGDVGLYYDREYKFIDLDLSGKWGFELLDNHDGQFPTGKTTIMVPAYWESQGYYDYDGKAKYTKEFRLTSKLAGEDLYLMLGHIDDIETVYINGKKIGSIYDLGKQKYRPYYQIYRGYEIPLGILKVNGTNTITVEVLDKGGPGGIFKGPIGITTTANYEVLMEENKEYEDFWDYFWDQF